MQNIPLQLQEKNLLSFDTQPLHYNWIHVFHIQKPSNDYVVGIAIITPDVQLLSNTLQVDPTDKKQCGKSFEEFPANIIYERNNSHGTELDTKNLHGPGYTQKQAKNKQNKAKQLMEPMNPMKQLPLKWISLSKDGLVSAELLISAELIEISADCKPPEAITRVICEIPKQICPVIAMYRYNSDWYVWQSLSQNIINWSR